MMKDLARAIAAWTDAHPGANPWMTAIDGLILLRADHEKPPSHIISRPALCVVAQGAKWTSFGDERHSYHAGEALVVTVEMPSVGRVIQASSDAPFLGAVVEFDPAILRELLGRLDEPPVTQRGADRHGAFVIDMDAAVTDCTLRLIRLLGEPKAIPILAPMLMRELSYRLLTSPVGGVIADMTLGSDHPAQIMRAIALLRDQFIHPLRIADLAAEAHLSPSAFHRQFKAVTAMTPLQYQKQLRLLEARRMILTEHAKVETAAYATGYESPSQFSREYSRMFGIPPKRDARSRDFVEWT